VRRHWSFSPPSPALKRVGYPHPVLGEQRERARERERGRGRGRGAEGEGQRQSAFPSHVCGRNYPNKALSLIKRLQKHL